VLLKSFALSVPCAAGISLAGAADKLIQVVGLIGKEERSRRRGSWAERREGDLQTARFEALQGITSQTKEPSRRPSSQVQEICLELH
jgi:hypothetical protein